MPETFSSDPVFGGLFVMLLVIMVLIRENLEIRRRAGARARELTDRIRHDQEVIDSLEEEVASLSRLLTSGTRQEPEYRFQPENRELWACAILMMDPDKRPFSSGEIAAARRRMIKIRHPDSGGIGRIQDVEEAADTLLRAGYGGA